MGLCHLNCLVITVNPYDLATHDIAWELADLPRSDRTFAQLDAPGACDEVGDIVGNMRTGRALGQQLASEADWVHNNAGTCITGEKLVLDRGDGYGDARMRCKPATGEDDQHCGIVTTGADDDVAGSVDLGDLQYFVVGRIAFDGGDAPFLDQSQATTILIDYDDPFGRMTPFEQFADRSGPRSAIAADDDMIL